jgi:hypothetical protein
VFQHGELVEVDGIWHVVMSSPDPWDPSLHRWRDGHRYTVPELVDPEHERRVNEAPSPAPPDDTLDRYIVVRATP